MEPISLGQGRLRGPILHLQSDERLAQLVSDGDERAFEALVRRHRPTLERACRRILRGPRVEDATQQALLSAHQALRRNGPPDRFEPWLHRIAVNAALKELGATPEELPLDDERLDGVEQPAERLERRERLRETIGAIGELPESQRRALLLREMEGRSHGEIARDLGLTPGAVRQLIHRARTGVRSAATALTPYALLLRMGTDSEGSARAAEIVAGGAGGAYVAKTLAAAVIAGGVAGGVTMLPDDGPPARAAEEARLGGGGSDGGGDPASAGSASGSGHEGEREREHDKEGRDDSDGPDGHDDDDSGERRRGTSSGSDDDSSGSGSDHREEAEEDSDDDSSGAGSGGSDSGGSGSDDDSSGSGSGGGGERDD